MSVYRKLGQVILSKEEVLQMLVSTYTTEAEKHEQLVANVQPNDMSLRIMLDGSMQVLHNPTLEQPA